MVRITIRRQRRVPIRQIEIIQVQIAGISVTAQFVAVRGRGRPKNKQDREHKSAEHFSREAVLLLCNSGPTGIKWLNG